MFSRPIGRIEKYAVRGREALAGEELLQTWVVWNVIAHDLPALRGRVEEILAQEDLPDISGTEPSVGHRARRSEREEKVQGKETAGCVPLGLPCMRHRECGHTSGPWVTAWISDCR
jgi:hypothetical protein